MLSTIETAYKMWFTHDGTTKPALCDLTVLPDRNAVLVLRIRYSDAPDCEAVYALVSFSTASWLIDLISQCTVFLSDPCDSDSTKYALKKLDLEDVEIEELAAALKFAFTHTDYELLEALDNFSRDPSQLF